MIPCHHINNLIPPYNMMHYASLQNIFCVGSCFNMTGSQFCVVGSCFNMTGSQFYIIGSYSNVAGSQFYVVGSYSNMAGSQFHVVGSYSNMAGRRLFTQLCEDYYIYPLIQKPLQMMQRLLYYKVGIEFKKSPTDF